MLDVPDNEKEFCNAEQSTFFIQTACMIIPKPESPSRLLLGLIYASVAIFIFLFSLVYFDYIYEVLENKYVEYDVKTLTAGDYTVEFEISQDQYEEFKARYFKWDSPMQECA